MYLVVSVSDSRLYVEGGVMGWCGVGVGASAGTSDVTSVVLGFLPDLSLKHGLLQYIQLKFVGWKRKVTNKNRRKGQKHVFS